MYVKACPMNIDAIANFHMFSKKSCPSLNSYHVMIYYDKFTLEMYHLMMSYFALKNCIKEISLSWNLTCELPVLLVFLMLPLSAATLIVLPTDQV